MLPRLLFLACGDVPDIRGLATRHPGPPTNENGGIKSCGNGDERMSAATHACVCKCLAFVRYQKQRR